MYDSADTIEIMDTYRFAVTPTLVEQFATKTTLLYLPAVFLTGQVVPTDRE
jgi:hypothetical protein